MDYFSPRTPAAGGQSSYADSRHLEPGTGNGDGEGQKSPSYFTTSNGGKSGGNHLAKVVEERQSVEGGTAAEGGEAGATRQPMPTANPFKLGNAHPTAFPVQNGATFAFQQALMQRQGSHLSGLPTSGLMGPQTPLSFPGEKRKSAKRPSAPHGISMPPKSPRNISISSPRKMESVSPPSSPDHHQGSEPHKARKSPRSPPVPSNLSSSSSYQASSNPFARMSLPGSSFASNGESASQPIPPPMMHNLPSMKMPTGAISGRTMPSSMSLPIPGALRQSAPLRYNTSGQSACAPMSMAARRAATVQNARFKAVNVPQDIVPILANDGSAGQKSTKTLVVDLRPHTAFVSQGRIKGSINVCVPSTLLRRPMFGLQKIAETLPSQKDRTLFSHAVGLESSRNLEGKIDKILVIDTEINALTAESAINSLLSKLEKAGFEGDLCWLKGGWNGLDRYLSNHEESGEMGDKLNALVDWDQLYEASESEDDMEVETNERMQDVNTPHQQGVPIAGGGGGGDGGKSTLGIGGGLGTRPSSGQSSGSSFNSSSADSLLPSGYSSSSTSLDTQSNPSLSAFDSKKMALPDLRSTSSPAESADMISSTSQSSTTTSSKSSSANSNSTTTGKSKPSVLRPMNLPMSAFQFGSTAAFSASEGSGRRGTASTAASRPGSSSSTRATSPNREKKAEYPTAGAGGTKAVGMKKQAANPFFDNIRQNIESTSLEQTLAHVQPFLLPEKFTRPSVQHLLPTFLQDLIKLSPRARAEKLHREYFEIEQGERKRLQKVLAWHCQQSAVVEVERSGVPVKMEPEDKDGKDGKKDGWHPFSISAGVEKGHLNRYKNMWPYEHARVRLAHDSSPTCGDYINASHIRLRGTNKTYIASQGPLESTTEHFWKLVLQENVNVIVMLTLLAEGGREKCSNYFQTGEYGSISLKLTKEVGDEETMKTSVNQEIGFFATEDVSAPKDSAGWSIENFVGPSGKGKSRLDSSTVRRTVEITDKNAPPGTAPKVVRHIQYIRWPDFDIPPEPECVLELIAETSRAQEELDAVESPVLVHCSAGVGRTGTFIAVDTLLERYRRERHPVTESPASTSAGGDYMDVDSNKRATTPPSASRQSSRSRRAGSNTSNSEAIGNLTLDSDHESSPQPPSVSTFSSAQSQRTISHRHTGSSDSSSPTALLARLERKDLQPQDYSDPIKSLVDQMREQRMSSVANAGQYVFTHLALLAGLVAELTEEGLVSKD